MKYFIGMLALAAVASVCCKSLLTAIPDSLESDDIGLTADAGWKSGVGLTRKTRGFGGFHGYDSGPYGNGYGAFPYGDGYGGRPYGGGYVGFPFGGDGSVGRVAGSNSQASSSSFGGVLGGLG